MERTGHRAGVAITGVLAGATLIASAGVAAAPAPSCFPKGSKTLAATTTARVFETRRGTYGCLYRYGRARRLDPDRPNLDLEADAYTPFKFSGPYVAYQRVMSQGCGPDVCFWSEVVVADLRPTKPLVLQKQYAASDETLRPFGEDSLDAEAFVTDLVLLRNGAVGWIVCEGNTVTHCADDADAQERAQTSVFAAAPASRSRKKLDEGAGIAKRSLTWSSGAFHWRHDGQQRSAPYR